MGGEPQQGRHQAVEQVETPHRRQDLLQGDRAVRDLRGDRVAHVHADSQSQPLQRIALPAPLAQDAGDLAIHDDDVVRPFELGDGTTGELVHHIGQHEPRPDGHDTELPVGGLQQHPQPHATGRGVPGASDLTASGGLLFRDDHGARRGVLGGELVNAVEGGGDPAKQAALRHAPAPRQGRRGDAVQL